MELEQRRQAMLQLHLSNNVIAYWGATYIRCLKVISVQNYMKPSNAQRKLYHRVRMLFPSTKMGYHEISLATSCGESPFRVGTFIPIHHRYALARPQPVANHTGGPIY